MLLRSVQCPASILQNNQTTTGATADLPVLREEAEGPELSLKGWKSPGTDSVTAELLKQGRRDKGPQCSVKTIWEWKEDTMAWCPLQEKEANSAKATELSICQSFQ